MTELHKVFCYNLKRLREERNLSQVKLAGLIGMDQARFSKIENGKVEPGLLTIEKIAVGLEVNVSELFLHIYEDDSLISKMQIIKLLPEKDRLLMEGLVDSFVEKDRILGRLREKTEGRLNELVKLRDEISSS